MLDDASLAKLFDSPISFCCDRTILNVELLQAAAMISHILDALIGDHFAAFDTQFFQARAKL